MPPLRLHKVDSMRELYLLQHLMATAIMRPLTSSDHMQPKWVGKEKTSSVVAEFIKPNSRLTSFERLEIYNRQYWFRILGCFYEDFPGLRAVMGDRKFEAMAQRYLTYHPSRSFTLRNLGSQIETFLREEPHWTLPHEKLVLDMARFEWTQINAFDGEQKPVLSPGHFSGKELSKMRLSLQPYLYLLELHYPIDDFLVSLKKHNEMRSDASNAVEEHKKVARQKKAPLPKPQQTYVAIHRQNDVLYYKRLEPEAYQILVGLKNDLPIAEACARALLPSLHQNQDWPAKIREWFQAWMSLGWFCKN